MAPTIRIDDEVYTWLQSQARPFEDNPNTVLRKIAGLDGTKKLNGLAAKERRVNSAHTPRGRKTPQQAFRVPLLRLLKRHDGEMHRAQALKELEGAMTDQLTDFDKADINSGTVRWEKSAEWEVRAMREQGLLKPVLETSRGIWALSDKGLEAASAVK